MPLERLVAHGRVTFETAAKHASDQVPIASPGERAEDVRRAIVGKKFASASHIVVCEGDKLRGILRLEDLLAAPADSHLDRLMDREAPVVGPGEDQEGPAWHAVQHGESTLCVVDRDGRFVGIIPPHRLLAVLLSEHERTSAARATSDESVVRRFGHRLPWLLVGLGGALVAADLVGWFEAQLKHKLMLAFFIPGIIYLADAVGTQTETVVVRGLSVGVGMGRMAGRELLAGLAMGAALGALSGPLVWWRWGNQDIALCVALSVFAACAAATVTGMAVVWLFAAFGRDPAFGTAPLSTVIQDLLSILIYFVIALGVVR